MAKQAQGVSFPGCGTRKAGEPIPVGKVGAFGGVELQTGLQLCNLFIIRSNKSDETGRNAESRYATGTRNCSKEDV